MTLVDGPRTPRTRLPRWALAPQHAAARNEGGGRPAALYLAAAQRGRRGGHNVVTNCVTGGIKRW